MTSSAEPRDPAFETRVRDSFERQRLMATIGARLARVSPGDVEIEAPFGEGLTKQHRYLHGRIVTALVDSACGYSALSLAPPECGVLRVEFQRRQALFRVEAACVAVPWRRTLATAPSRARLPDRDPTRLGDAAVKGIRILGTNRSSIRPADDVAAWARASTAVTEN